MSCRHDLAHLLGRGRAARRHGLFYHRRQIVVGKLGRHVRLRVSSLVLFLVGQVVAPGRPVRLEGFEPPLALPAEERQLVRLARLLHGVDALLLERRHVQTQGADPALVAGLEGRHAVCLHAALERALFPLHPVSPFAGHAGCLRPAILRPVLTTLTAAGPDASDRLTRELDAFAVKDPRL